MKKLLLPFLLAGAVAAHAATVFTFDFDSLNPGDDANLLAPSELSFHSAVFAPLQDGDGIEIPGTDRWTFTDDYGPVTVDSTLDFGFGAAPSGTNALNAFYGDVFVKFDQAYDLSSFSVTLDNSTFGDLGDSHVWFVSDTATLQAVTFDATVPGTVVTASNISGVTGIVMQGGGFYDNLSVGITAIPEPSTYAMCLGAGVLALAGWRRFRRSA